MDGELPPLVNCHCRFCRRAHGAAFVTIAWLPHSRFRITAGADKLSRYDVGDGFRAFCSMCGTRLYNGSKSGTGFMTLVVSTLDDGEHGAPVLHLNVESKASWYEIVDDLPQFERFSPEVVAYLQKLGTP